MEDIPRSFCFENFFISQHTVVCSSSPRGGGLFPVEGDGEEVGLASAEGELTALFTRAQSLLLLHRGLMSLVRVLPAGTSLADFVSSEGDLDASGRFLSRSITSKNSGTSGLMFPSSCCSSRRPVGGGDNNLLF